jgi:hypothetical protein
LAHTVSILIIGSLIWNDQQHRASWRARRLLVDEKTTVRAPIRYGRLSGDKTSKSYTMVFSKELEPNRLGDALAVPCRCRVKTVHQLFEEGEALWAAEQRDTSMPGPLAASWGAVGLLCNPNIAGLAELKGQWSQRVADEHPIYRGFPHANGEETAIGPDGLLTIAWPKTESGDDLAVDLLLATATKPEPLVEGHYAPPNEIAAAWTRHPERRKYFEQNRQHRITTAFDDEILGLLNS